MITTKILKDFNNAEFVSFWSQLRDLVVRAFACEAWKTGLDSQLSHTKDFKNGLILSWVIPKTLNLIADQRNFRA